MGSGALMEINSFACFKDATRVASLSDGQIERDGFSDLWSISPPDLSQFRLDEVDLDDRAFALRDETTRSARRLGVLVLATSIALPVLWILALFLLEWPTILNSDSVSLSLLTTIGAASILFATGDHRLTKYNCEREQLASLSDERERFRSAEKHFFEEVLPGRRRRTSPNFWSQELKNTVPNLPPEALQFSYDDSEDETPEDLALLVPSDTVSTPNWRKALGVWFEMEVAALLRQKGFKVGITGSSGDHGVDIFACDGCTTMILQCKYLRGNTPVSVIRDLAGAKHCFRADKAILVTRKKKPTGDQARYFSEQCGLEFWAADNLAQLANEINSAAALPVRRMSPSSNPVA